MKKNRAEQLNKYPVRLSEHAWFYRNPKSIDVYIRVPGPDGEHYMTANVRVPLKKIANSKPWK